MQGISLLGSLVPRGPAPPKEISVVIPDKFRVDAAVVALCERYFAELPLPSNAQVRLVQLEPLRIDSSFNGRLRIGSTGDPTQLMFIVPVTEHEAVYMTFELRDGNFRHMRDACLEALSVGETNYPKKPSKPVVKLTDKMRVEARDKTIEVLREQIVRWCLTKPRDILTTCLYYHATVQDLNVRRPFHHEVVSHMLMSAAPDIFESDEHVIVVVDDAATYGFVGTRKGSRPNGLVALLSAGENHITGLIRKNET